MNIYLRPLREEDALVSYRWRNNPAIWKLTGNKPNAIVTPEIETNWIREVLNKTDQRRFAICVEGSDEYIGNAQLTGIDRGTAEFHIFIGEEKYWGQGIGTKATKFVVEIGFKLLGLREIYLFVNKKNVAAVKAYLNCGFLIDGCSESRIKMVVHNGE